jgi:hypothetical protein
MHGANEANGLEFGLLKSKSKSSDFTRNTGIYWIKKFSKLGLEEWLKWWRLCKCKALSFNPKTPNK